MQIEDDEGVDVAAVEPAVAAEVEEEDVHVGGEDEPEDNDDEGYDSFIEERSRLPPHSLIQLLKEMQMDGT